LRRESRKAFLARIAWVFRAIVAAKIPIAKNTDVPIASLMSIAGLKTSKAKKMEVEQTMRASAQT